MVFIIEEKLITSRAVSSSLSAKFDFVAILPNVNGVSIISWFYNTIIIKILQTYKNVTYKIVSYVFL